MERIDLSTNSRKIQDAYDKVVRSDSSTSYVVYTVEKGGVLNIAEIGSGPLDEFVEHFDDGKIQFGLARVTVPGSDVSKVLSLGWCPDNAPSKSRLSFSSNFAEVSRVLSGYHVQITARDQDDLDVDEFLQRVSAASGARYSIQTAGGATISKKPPPSKPFQPKTSSQPSSFVPKSTGKPIAPVTPKPIVPKPSGSSFGTSSKKTAASEDDEWGGEKEIEERDFSQKPLETVPSAYKPTKVNIDELRKQKSNTVSSQPKPHAPKESSAPSSEPQQDADSEPKSLSDRLQTFKSNESAGSIGSDGRLTSLPKPKINNSVASRFTPTATSSDSSNAPTFGAKPSFGAGASAKKDVVGGASRNFANQGGKTPAQIWAEKKGQYKTVPSDDSEPIKSTPSGDNNELAQKFKQLNVGANEEEDKEESNDDEDQETEPPVRASFPTPPKRSLPPAPAPAFSKPEQEEEDEDEDEENEVSQPPQPAPAPSLPARNLPPPPVRQVPAAAPIPAAAEPESEEEEEEEEEQVARSQPPPPSLPARSGPVKQGPTAVAEYDYEKDEDNEIAFEEGDLIIEIEFVDEDWWSGKHSKTGETGLFPASYVALKEDEPSTASSDPAPAPASVSSPSAEPTAKSNGNLPTAVAEYDYEKDEDNEISFNEGDLITEIEFVDDDWWSGKNAATNEVGLFPANYVKLKN